MQDSKLIELLKTFSKKEHKQLLKFVRFRSIDDGKTVVLMEHILSFAPLFDSADLNKETLFKAIYSNKKEYKDVLMRQCLSRLLQMCEEYLVFLKSQDNERFNQLTLIEYYSENKLKRHFEAVLRNWNKTKQGEVVVNNLYFLEEFLIEKEISFHLFQQQDRTIEPNLDKVSDNLDTFYLMHKLKVCCTSLNYQSLSATQYELPLIDKVIEYLNEKWINHHPIVQAYYFVLLTLKYPEKEKYFQRFKNILFENLSQFHFNQQGDLFSLAQNYCIKRINKGDKQYLAELLELYKVGLKMEVVLENGILSPLDYKNIVTLGTRLKAYDWTEDFIEKYTNNLEESFRESAYNYNLARLFFSKSEFGKIIDLLHQVEHREVFVELDAKVLLLKTYYELEEIEPMISLVESFRMFLSRKKNLGYHKSRYQNFLKFLRQLNRLNVATKAEKAAFKEQVLNEKELIEKEWFLEKI